MTRAAVLVAAALAAHAAAQPLPVGPTYTAFPELNAPPRPLPRDAKGEYPDRHARLRAAAGAPTVRCRGRAARLS